MPIPRKDFEKGVDSSTKKVYDLLGSRPDEAFTSTEIAREMRLDIETVVEILNYLAVDRELISRRKIVETYYYSSKKEEG